MWLKQSAAASRNMGESEGSDASFYHGKLRACQYFFRYELSKVPERLTLLARCDDTCLGMENSWF